VRYTPDVPPRKPSPDAERPKRRKRRSVVQGFFGVGLDAKDGHTRITRGEHFVLLGGSDETHERMQDFAVKLHERMKNEGKSFGAISPGDLRRLARGL
jgi:hypothetical protein